MDMYTSEQFSYYIILLRDLLNSCEVRCVSVEVLALHGMALAYAVFNDYFNPQVKDFYIDFGCRLVKTWENYVASLDHATPSLSVSA